MKQVIARDGIKLAYYSRRPASTARAAVLIIHGMGDHAQALPYRLLTDYLLSENFLVVSSDLRGHGQSEGHRMYVDRIEDFVNDIMLVLKEMKHETGELPLYVIGLSMGGLIGLHLAIKKLTAIKGIVIVSPALDASGSPAIVRMMVPLLAAIAPKKQLDIKLDLKFISRDEKAVREYTSDNFWQVKVTPKLGNAVLQGMKQIHSLAASFFSPLLLIQGSADKIVPLKGGRSFFSKAGSPDKKMIVFDGGYHNLFIDVNRNEIFEHIGQWIANGLNK